MKKIYHIIILATLLPAMSFAQLKVNSSGNVGIKKTPSSTYALDIEGLVNISKSNITGTEQAFNITTNYNGAGGLGNSMKITNNSNICRRTIGLLSYAYNTNDTASSTVGINGFASALRSRRVYGVSGVVSSGLHGAGIFGAVGTSSTGYTHQVDGKYAGYFYGNVKVTGTINGTLLNSSDERLKEDVTDIGENQENVLTKISLLSPVSYKYKQTEQDVINETEKDELEDGLEDINKESLKAYEKKLREQALRTHFGFVAQELQQVYPELVYEQDNGYLAINYVELIPVLVQSIKELNAKVEELSAPRPAKAQAMNATADVETADFYTAAMGQNVPNPFSERTEIAITLSENVKKAMLYIYDMTGKQVEQHEVTGRGKTTMTIYADRMNAGMYIYALVADGKVVTSKKMIVTK